MNLPSFAWETRPPSIDIVSVQFFLQRGCNIPQSCLKKKTLSTLEYFCVWNSRKLPDKLSICYVGRIKKPSHQESLSSNGPRGAGKEEKVRRMTNDLVFRLRPNSMEKFSQSKTPVRADRPLGIRMTAEELNIDKETVRIIVTTNLNQWRIQIRGSGLAQR